MSFSKILYPPCLALIHPKKTCVDPEGGGGGGVRTLPEKSQKYRVS